MTHLARRLGFFALLVYGIGDILGAGIYALVGKVIGIAGAGAWATFLLAALVAVFTGFSYAEMSGRFPSAGGAAVFVKRGFPGTFAATIIGIFVLGSGVVSAATVTAAFSGYLQEVIPINDVLAKLLLMGGMSFLSFWGIRESSRVNILLTAIEFAGLLAVIFVGGSLLDASALDRFWEVSRTEFHFDSSLAAVTIAFFAYIGFEDLSNLAEECKNPGRDMPRAILGAIGVTTLVYLGVTLILLMTVDRESIAASKTPLLLVFQQAGLGWFLKYFALIAVVAITNTGLVNLIMASRLLYGMANEGLLPKTVARVHAARQTPWVGVLIAFAAVAFLVFTGTLKVLAQTTSCLILVVFLFVHFSLLRVKARKEPYDGMRFPFLFPAVGSLLCLILLTQFPGEVFLRSGIFLAAGLLVWFLGRLRERGGT